jgi:iron(III) transport system permease protein
VSAKGGPERELRPILGAASAATAGIVAPAAVFAPAGRDRVTLYVIAAAVAALLVVPWAAAGGPSALMRAIGGDVSLWPVLTASAIALACAYREADRWTAVFCGFAVAWAFVSALVTGPTGPSFGWGAAIALAALTVAFARAIARRGVFAGDPTVATIVVVIATLLVIFIFYPVAKSLLAALFDARGNFAPQLAAQRLLTEDIWGLGCFGGGTRCGVAINSAILATLVGILSTLLGLVFALVVQRGGGRYSGILKLMSILPIVTPPFVIALALVVLFGRTGLVTGWLDACCGIPRSRWIYGLPGVTLAQLLTFSPIAFMILYGALQAISPALEEAAQTLRASRARVFRTVTWPLLRPALANAFLLGFVESLADFGNPIVLAGNFDVLSTKIFFAVAGAQHDPGRAAALAAVLLGLTLIAFYLQQRWIGRLSYVTVTGKGDGGLPGKLPKPLWNTVFAIAVSWIAFTLVCYLIIFIGGFVKDIGRGDMTLTFHHLLQGFAIAFDNKASIFTGSAWPSLFNTITVAAVAAPLTAAIGLLAAYVITRHRFVGRRAFEFLTLVSFAIPGTVIGVSYIVAFNVAPLELTGGMAILVLCFVFRNMPVGVRAGVAALAQIDKTLDEASSTLRASTVRTLREVILPLLRPAILATLVFSFTHAMTAVSAVIFLATAKYNLATVYVINRVEAGEYPLAIAYSAVLIVVMLFVLLAMQLLVGDTRLGRRSAPALVTGN